MSKSALIASRVHTLIFGPNSTETSISELLEQHNFDQFLKARVANQSAAAVLFHIHYYQKVQLEVLNGRRLTAKDSESFKLPSVQSELDWITFKQEVLQIARELTLVIAVQEEGIWLLPFVKPEYGTYESNLLGMLEHSYYHFGQMRTALLY